MLAASYRLSSSTWSSCVIAGEVDRRFADLEHLKQDLHSLEAHLVATRKEVILWLDKPKFKS